MSEIGNRHRFTRGVRPAAGCGVAANVFLGLSSLYWRALAEIPSLTLLMYRILLSLLTLGLLVGCARRIGSLWKGMTAKAWTIHICAAVLVVLNWASFIWASIHGHVVESGLGYLVAPFVAIALGTFAFKDRLSRIRKLAIVLIVLAVVWLILRSGELAHWVYLTIACTWGGYACLKKVSTLDSITGLFIETLVLACLIPFLLAFTDIRLALPDGLGLGTHLLLLACGVVSVLPLYLFARAAASLSLSTMGLFQFVLPTTQLLVALLIYRQAVSPNTLGCFAAIWLALLFIVSEPILKRKGRGALS